jgi:RNA polymerase sigma factor (sigma-70 family)
MRRRTVRIVRLDPALDTAAASHESESVVRTALLRGLEELPPKMRAAVVLRYYADLTVDECARALGKSPNTIKAQLQEGLDRLRVQLAETSSQDARKALEARGA